MDAVRAVMFDLGSMLIGWQPELVYRKLIRDPEQRAWFLAEVARAPWDTEPVRDGAFEEGLRRLADSGQPVDLLAKYHDRMLQEMLADPMRQTARLLQHLKRMCRRHSPWALPRSTTPAAVRRWGASCVSAASFRHRGGNAYPGSRNGAGVLSKVDSELL
jgi:hypothetical protein